MTRTLVTGATGFIGANVARRLLRTGHEVHVLVRPGRPRWRIDDIAADIRPHESDLRDRERVRAVVRAVRPETLFHFAAFGAYPFQTDIVEMSETNLLGTANLLDAAREVDVTGFVHTGTSSEYGFKTGAATERDMLEPNSPYAITKAAATHCVQLAARAHDFPAVVLRLYSVYGPWEEPSRLMPRLLTLALRGEWPPLQAPSTARDFVYVDDVVDAVMATAAAAPRLSRGAVYNVCSGFQTTLAEVVAEVRCLAGVTREPSWSTMAARPWDTDCWVGSPDTIASALGWRPATSLHAGLEQMLAWLQENEARRPFYEAAV